MGLVFTHNQSFNSSIFQVFLWFVDAPVMCILHFFLQGSGLFPAGGALGRRKIPKFWKTNVSVDFSIVYVKTFPKIPNWLKLVNNLNRHFWFQIYKGIAKKL